MLTLQLVAFLGAAVLLPIGVLLLGLGLRRPESGDAAAAIPVPSTDWPVPHLVRRIAPADRHSTDAERRECRARLGSAYDTHLVVVADNLAQRPAAMRGIEMEPDDLPIDDLVTVSAFLHGQPVGPNRALRLGTAEPDRGYVACLASGLRRFPTHRGACYGAARTVGIPLDAYQAGQIIVEPAFIRTDAQWSPTRFRSETGDDTEILFAFWSRTGRQVGALGDGSDDVVFVAGTSFRVLGVDPPTAAGGAGVVFLGESPDPARSALLRAHPGWELPGVLAQLRRRIAVDPADVTGQTPRALPELGFTPGFDETGRPYQEEPVPSA